MSRYASLNYYLFTLMHVTIISIYNNLSDIRLAAKSDR